jgi:hypothetical protein
MKKALFLLLIINSFNLTAQNIDDCICTSDSRPMEVGALTEQFQLYDKDYNTTNYRWIALYTFPEKRCIPKDHDDTVWPKMKLAILNALHNDKTYKQLLASIDEEQKKVLRAIGLGTTGGLAPKGGFSNSTNSGVNIIYLNVDLKKFVTNYKKCSAINKKDELKDSKKGNSSNSYTESIYQKRQREAAELKNSKQRASGIAQNEANQQMIRNKERQAQLEKASANLSKELDRQLEETFNSWAKQSEFNKTMNTLKRIESKSINSIIAEVKRKSRNIDSQYAQRKISERNRIANQGNYYANKTKTQSELKLSNSITGLAQMLSQNSIEKQRREAQKELRQEQRNSEEALQNRFIEKILPSFKHYFELAIKSVYPNEEEYYTELYTYNECLIDNAYSILSGYNDCSKPSSKKPTRNPKPSANDFYNAYIRKKNSSNEYMKRAAGYQLELAIDANPNNAKWLYESVLTKEMNIYEKTAILKKAHALDSYNSQIKKAFETTLNDLETLKKKEKAYFTKHNHRYPDFEWELRNGLKGITIDNHIFFVNQDGEEVFKIDNFEKSLWRSFSHLTRINHCYEDDENQFGNGLARFGKMKDGNLLYGYINIEGEIIIPAQFSTAAQFSEGLAAVQDKETKLWGYIEESGKLIIPYQFSKASYFSKGLAAILHSSYPYGAYLNKKGKVAIEGKKKFIISEPFVNGVSMVQTGTAGSYTWQSHEDHYKYILPSGDFLFKKRFVKTFPFNKKGYAIVGSANRYNIIDKSGKKQCKKSFKEYPVFINRKAKVDIGTLLSGYYKHITIDETGKTIE